MSFRASAFLTPQCFNQNFVLSRTRKYIFAYNVVVTYNVDCTNYISTAML